MPRFGSLLAEDPHANVQITVVAEITPGRCRANGLDSARSFLRGLCIYPRNNHKKMGYKLPKGSRSYICSWKNMSDLRQEVFFSFSLPQSA